MVLFTTNNNTDIFVTIKIKDVVLLIKYNNKDYYIPKYLAFL
ncbi:hypothetical protein SOJ_27020 [Staphylococcus sp. OJ82]|nr:hypothetical protein SOJ_27020 [Staphylococcus sp. OJ82]